MLRPCTLRFLVVTIRGQSQIFANFQVRDVNLITGKDDAPQGYAEPPRDPHCGSQIVAEVVRILSGLQAVVVAKGVGCDLLVGTRDDLPDQGWSEMIVVVFFVRPYLPSKYG
jgi:hypothetical protein